MKTKGLKKIVQGQAVRDERSQQTTHTVLIFLSVATGRKSWLLHYSLPVIRGVLKPLYCTHFALLATAIAILTAEVITTDGF